MSGVSDIRWQCVSAEVCVAREGQLAVREVFELRGRAGRIPGLFKIRASITVERAFSAGDNLDFSTAQPPSCIRFAIVDDSVASTVASEPDPSTPTTG